jgi:uncharacterized heparinase superfamily protein
MTQDEIIEVAVQSGFEIDCCSLDWHKRIAAFAKLVAAAAASKERKACLQIQEDWQYQYANDLVQKIRARGES